MATWHTKLKTATFRGVAFGVTSSDLKGGRRTATFEFPGKDRPFVEDLGGRAQTHSVEAFVVGDDYMTDRDILMQALQVSGPGRLVHPYLGEITVQVTEWSVKESQADGGMAVFSISFAETTEQPEFPKVVENKVADIFTTVDEAATAAGISAAGKISGNSGVLAAMSVIRTAAAAIRAKYAFISSYVSQGDEFFRAVSELEDATEAFARAPQTLAGQVQSIFALIRTTGDDLVAGSKNVLNFYVGVTAALDLLTFGTDSETDAALAVKAIFSSVIVGTAVKMASLADYETLAQADDTREQIFDTIDELVLWVDDDDVFGSLLSIKILLAATVPPEGAVLKNIVQVEFPEAVPSLAASWSIYGDVSHEDEIIGRNKIRHPGAVGGAAPVEVLK